MIFSSLFQRRSGFTLDDLVQHVDFGGYAPNDPALFEDTDNRADKGRSLERQALTVSTYWACLAAVSGDIASLPFRVLERSERYRKPVANSRVQEIFTGQANDELDGFRLKELLQTHSMMHGIGAAEIEFDSHGGIKALWPLRGDKTRPVRKNGRLYYQVTLVKAGKIVELPAERIFRLNGFGPNPLRGAGTIKTFSRLLGISIAIEEFLSKYFWRGTHLGLTLKFPTGMKRESRDLVRDGVEQWHGGLDKAHRILALEEGVDVGTVGRSNVDSQTLELSRLKAQEVPRLFGIPPQRVGIYDQAIKATAEQEAIQYVAHCLGRAAARFEAAIDTQLLEEGQSAKFFTNGLLRGDAATRSKWYREMVTNGIMTVNEVRILEDLEPFGPEGDVPRAQLSYAPLSMVDMESENLDDEEGATDAREEMAFMRRQSLALGGVPSGTSDSRLLARRRQLRESVLPIFERSAERWVRAEARAARRALDESLDLVSFERNLITAQGRIRDSIFREQWPVVQTWLAFALPILSPESRGSALRVLSVAVQPGIRSAVESLGALHFEESRKLLQQQATVDEPMAALRAEITRWETGRAHQVAIAEVSRLEGELVLAILRLRGTATKVLVADESSCSRARILSGQTFPIDQPLDQTAMAPPFEACAGCTCAIR